MIITVDRFHSDDDATISRILVDDRFVCFGLEDEYRELKVAGETRIPAGLYRVRLRTAGGFHQRYSSRYDFHRGMLQVMDVPGFEYILIHTGNTDKDTAGCLLVGEVCFAVPGALRVGQSRNAYTRLYRMVLDAAAMGLLQIAYLDSDR